MQVSTQPPRSTLVIGPTTEPLTIHQAKKQCEIATSDTTHDDHLYRLIRAAREQWEHDTGQVLIKQRWQVILPYPQEFEFSLRPVSSIVSVQYYDTGNTSQTLSSSVYQLDSARSSLRLAYLQTWPSTSQRWDAVTILYIVGDHDNSTTIPLIAQQAMLLLIGHYFENRDMLLRGAEMAAYDALVQRYMRSSYP